MTTIDPHDLATVTGGTQLDPGNPQRLKGRLLQACGPQIDAYTAARKASASDPTDVRKEIDSVAAGRSLALCASNVGFDPPPAWRSFGPGK
ncbi:MAG TPA: hypothetical protein VLX92_25085 [Kofleriaceae bacterium]|nr:hypothetical protein [Kofleriaceae bacterium]